MAPLPLERLTADQALKHPWMVLKEDAESDSGDTAKLKDAAAMMGDFSRCEGDITQPATTWTTDVESVGSPATQRHLMQFVSPQPRSSVIIDSTVDSKSHQTQSHRGHISELLGHLKPGEEGGYEEQRKALFLPPNSRTETAHATDRKKFQASVEDGDEDSNDIDYAEKHTHQSTGVAISNALPCDNPDRVETEPEVRQDDIYDSSDDTLHTFCVSDESGDEQDERNQSSGDDNRRKFDTNESSLNKSVRFALDIDDGHDLRRNSTHALRAPKLTRIQDSIQQQTVPPQSLKSTMDTMKTQTAYPLHSKQRV